MLSTRGCQTMNVIIKEVVKTNLTTGRNVFAPSEVERTWKALCKMLRVQLLLGHNVAIGGNKTACYVYYKSRHIATDCDTKYFCRTPKFAFAQSFCTTFGLDSASVPWLDTTKRELTKLPLDLVAAEAGLPADLVGGIIREIFLYVGESLYNQRVMELDFEGVAQIIVKREKAAVSFDQKFLDDAFAIDARKWPVAVREAAQLVRGATSQPTPRSGRPSSAASSSASRTQQRPSSAQSRPTTAASTATTAATATAEQQMQQSNKPAFVSAGGPGRLFVDIEKIKEKQHHLQQQHNSARTTSSSRGQQHSAKPLKGPQSSSNNNNNNKNSARMADAGYDQENIRYQQQMQHGGAFDEEESVYSILSPERQHNLHNHHEVHLDPNSNELPWSRPQSGGSAQRQQQQQQRPAFSEQEQEADDGDEGEDYMENDYMCEEKAAAPTSGRGVKFGGVADAPRPASGDSAATNTVTPRTGRRHYDSDIFFAKPAIQQQQQYQPPTAKKTIWSAHSNQDQVGALLSYQSPNKVAGQQQQMQRQPGSHGVGRKRIDSTCNQDHVGGLLFDNLA